MKKLIVAVACLSVSACSGHLPSIDKDELSLLKAEIRSARDVGAEKCAPEDLAKAEVSQLYAAHEIDEHGGFNMSEADDLVASGMASAKSAIAKCSKPKPKPVAKAVVTKVKSIEVIKLAGVYFETNGATLKPASEQTLGNAVEVLKKRADIKVEVSAFTDSRGKASYNKHLSSLRANSVKSYLVNHGIDAKRMTTHGYGEDSPVADNNTTEGRAKNRRVELRVQ